MKIDKIYISCCKNDFYFTRICVASVRYWNKNIPISLLKDLSKGDFDTGELQQHFNVELVPLHFKNLNAYCKLYPFFGFENSRIFLMDSDIIWLGDLIPVLEQFNEDIVIDGQIYNDKQASQWYFNIEKLKNNYPDFLPPDFLFNTGQLVLNTDKFSSKDFSRVIEWKENISPEKENVFLCEDQGIINYVVAKKIEQGQISYRLHHFFIWGWDDAVKKMTVDEIKNKIEKPFLIHWYGKKYGLISFLPGSHLLHFFESYYFSNVSSGKYRLWKTKLLRSMKHINYVLWEGGKKIFYKIRSISKWQLHHTIH